MKVPKYWKSKELLDATAREGDARRKLLEATERKHALELLKKDGTPYASTKNWYYDWEKE